MHGFSKGLFKRCQFFYFTRLFFQIHYLNALFCFIFHLNIIFFNYFFIRFSEHKQQKRVKIWLIWKGNNKINKLNQKKKKRTVIIKLLSLFVSHTYNMIILLDGVQKFKGCFIHVFKHQFSLFKY